MMSTFADFFFYRNCFRLPPPLRDAVLGLCFFCCPSPPPLLYDPQLFRRQSCSWVFLFHPISISPVFLRLYSVCEVPCTNILYFVYPPWDVVLQKRLAWALFVLLLSTLVCKPTELIWVFLFHNSNFYSSRPLFRPRQCRFQYPKQRWWKEKWTISINCKTSYLYTMPRKLLRILKYNFFYVCKAKSHMHMIWM